MPAHRKTAVVVLAGALLVGWFFGGRERVALFRTRVALERLVDTGAGRVPEARFTALSALPQVRAGAVSRGSTDTVALRARSSAVFQNADRVTSTEGRRFAAVAFVISGALQDAVKVLEAAVAAHPDDAKLWSDLAAARYERAAAREDDVQEFLAALVAADRSRSLDPNNANALFNRALIIERIGLRTLAVKAWRSYLDVETDPLRAAEAKQRADALEQQTWKKEQPELERAVLRGDSSTVETIVARYPQDARGYGEVIYLPNWAKAWLAGDATAAFEQLKITRAIAAALSKRGETFLTDVLVAFDTLTAEEDIRAFAIAVQDYDHGRDAYADFRHADGEPLFAAASRGFARVHNPMEVVSDAYRSFVIFGQNRVEEARTKMLAVANIAREHPGHRALLAYTLWSYGRVELFSGRWDDAVAALQEARSMFMELGETKNAGAIEGILAEAFEMSGRTEEAWQHCVASFGSVSAENNAFRLQVAIAGGVRIAMRTKSWDAAASLLDLELAVAADRHEPRLTADALRRLFEVQHERKDFAARDAALSRARLVTSFVKDEREQQTAELDQAEAMATVTTNPRRAVALLTRAIEFAVMTDRRLFLADLLHDRGRAHLAAGSADNALADFAAGVDELERQRGGIETTELRARFFDTADQLFTDIVTLEVQRGDAASAFRYADRARARALIDGETVAVAAPNELASTLATRLPNTTLVEFIVLEREVVAFCVREGRVTMHRNPTSAADLRRRVDELHEALDDKAPDRIRAAATTLYEILFGGLTSDLAATKSLILVPHDHVQRVPFGVLWSESAREYLVQSHTISVAPSAALLVSRDARQPSHRSILLVGNAAANEEEGLAHLTNVKAEIAAMQRIYPTSRVLLGAEATVPRFVAEAPSHDLLHFAGHGVADDDSVGASLLLAPSGNVPGRMYMSDIARLRLPRAPIVVLAACGTLRGPVTGVEGMPSLARSFLAAGASTVIGTLRDVNDATASDLLQTFHRAVADGDAPADALRKAQLDAIASGGAGADPVNWAPYVVYTAIP